MNKDRIAGAAENLAGRATSAAGRSLGSDRMVARGTAHRVSGKRRNILGSILDMLGIHRRPAPLARSRKENAMNEDEIEGGLRYAKGKVEKGVGDITTDTKWQADGVIDQIAGGAQNLYGRARDRLQDAIEDAPDRLHDAGEHVRDVAQRGRRIADDQVRDNPWLLVAAVGVAGYALSWFIHGQRD